MAMHRRSHFAQLMSAITMLAGMLLLTACQPVRPVAELTPAAIVAPTLSADEEAMAKAVTLFVAEQLDIAVEQLHVRSVEAMQWPDASLGCPQPDMIYAAVITPGYRVTVMDASKTHIVHTDVHIDGEKIICVQE